jgi:cytosine/uracil/thiamine/allantoin permease
MDKPLGLALLVVGIVLLVWGVSASHSVSSSFSQFITGSPSDKSMWLIIGGTLCAVAGLFSSFLRPR